MKTDYRKTLYGSYVSTFKTEHLDTDPRVRKDALLGVKHRFGPIFKDCNRDLSILEIGCGPGYLIEYWTKLGFKDVMGIDVSEEQINLARSKGLNAKIIILIVAGKYHSIWTENILCTAVKLGGDEN